MSLVFDRLRAAAPFAVASVLLMSLSGCGSSSSSNGANVRVFDAVTDGGSATVTLSGTTLVTNQPVFDPTYYLISTQTSPLIGFTLSNEPGTNYPTTQATLAFGSYYTINVFGRPDVPASDFRSPTVLYSLDDRTNPNIGDTRIRVVNAAPDLQPVDVTVTNTSLTPSVIPVGTNVPYKTTTAETETSAGTLPVTVNLTGTSTAVIPPVTYDFLNGNFYTIYVTEQATNPPAYGLVVLDDTSVAPAPLTNARVKKG